MVPPQPRHRATKETTWISLGASSHERGQVVIVVVVIVVVVVVVVVVVARLRACVVKEVIAARWDQHCPSSAPHIFPL